MSLITLQTNHSTRIGIVDSDRNQQNESTLACYVDNALICCSRKLLRSTGGNSAGLQVVQYLLHKPFFTGTKKSGVYIPQPER